MSRDMSRSRDSLEARFFKASVSSRDLEVSGNQGVSRLFLQVRFKLKRSRLTKENNFRKTAFVNAVFHKL